MLPVWLRLDRRGGGCAGLAQGLRRCRGACGAVYGLCAGGLVGVGGWLARSGVSGAGLEGGGFGVGAPFGAEGAADFAEGGFGAGGVQHGRDQIRLGARGGDQSG